MTNHTKDYLETILSILETYSRENKFSKEIIPDTPISMMIQDSLDLLEFAMKVEDCTNTEIKIEYLDTATTPKILNAILLEQAKK